MVLRAARLAEKSGGGRVDIRGGRSVRAQTAAHLAEVRMPTVLLVDDSKFARSTRAKALKSAGLSVLEAADGNEALQTVRTSGVDCVVTDLLMPVLDGFALIKKIRGSGSRVPVIVSTSDTQPGTVGACTELGANAVIGKAEDVSVLITAINSAIAQARALAAGAGKKEAA
jgi:CheY-like chemotaxis protein